MLKKAIPKLTLIIFLAMLSCSEEKNCIEYSANKGAIVDVIDLGMCYGILSKKDILVTDTIEYSNLKTLTNDSILLRMGCSTNPPLPKIDFDKYSLAGSMTTGSGCNVNYEREITIDSINKIVNYSIVVHECGECNDKRLNMNWVLLTKVDSLYRLETKISHN